MGEVEGLFTKVWRRMRTIATVLLDYRAASLHQYYGEKIIVEEAEKAFFPLVPSVIHIKGKSILRVYSSTLIHFHSCSISFVPASLHSTSQTKPLRMQWGLRLYNTPLKWHSTCVFWVSSAAAVKVGVLDNLNWKTLSCKQFLENTVK